MGAAALTMVRQFQPWAITLDIHLADIDGWRVLERLKSDIVARHIPVYVISTEDARERYLHSGAKDFLAKPIQNKQVLNKLLEEMNVYLSKSPKYVMVFDEKSAGLKKITQYVSGLPDVEIVAVSTQNKSRDALNTQAFDCIMVGASASIPTLEALSLQIQESPVNRNTPIVLLRDNGGVSDDAAGKILARHPMSRQVHSLERLLDQTTMLLHQGVDWLTERHRNVLNDIYQSDKPLVGRKVLIVDDDIRNIFALSSVLEECQMKIVSAESGRDAIDILKSTDDIDIVLMDIMMPEMDGIATMKEIRQSENFRNLPIVAVTAKAMKGDRERCIEAGAWDYLSKPVERQQLLSMLRAWLQR